jgi:hypothetical protein
LVSHETVIVSDFDAVTPLASVTVTVKVSFTAEFLTFPEINPVAELSERLAGKMPEVIDQV